MLNTDHQLYRLSETIDWDYLEKEIAVYIGGKYRHQWRLVSASIYLRSFYDLTSAEVIDRWSECPYFRFFCSGEVSIESFCCRSGGLIENSESFPIPLQVLDKLAFDFIGEGHDVMIKALLSKVSVDICQSKAFSTIH